MSSDSDAPPSEGGEKTERMDRLRALLTKPIKIPDSASGDNEDADYAAPVAAAAAPKGAKEAKEAKTEMTPRSATPKGAKIPVETPPAVKAAAEALDRLSDEEKGDTADSTQSGRPSKSRRTWADAYLAKPDKPLTPEEVRAELTVALKEQGTELRELVAKQGATQSKAQEQSLTQALDEAGERTAAELATSIEQATTTAQDEAARLREQIDELTSTTGALRTDLAAAHAAAASATTAASAARETADAAVKKAATSSVFAWVGLALALVAAVVAVVV